MTKFVYNNAKNVSTNHTLFELNCGYHLCISFEDNTNFYSRTHSAKKLANKLKNLIFICQQNLLHTQDK